MTETVRLEFEKFSGFITEYASNISLGGMFIKTEKPQPIGSQLRFEIVLSDGFRLVQGTGEVAWTRSEAQGPDKPAGMGIRFHQLEDSSRELIDKMVYHRLMDGGKPFELEQAFDGQKQAAAAAVPPAALPPAAPPPAEELELPLPDDAELLEMESVPSLEASGDPSFAELENALETPASTLVEPPPDVVAPRGVDERPASPAEGPRIDVLGEAAELDAGLDLELPMADPGEIDLGDIGMPAIELPASDEPSLAMPELPTEIEELSLPDPELPLDIGATGMPSQEEDALSPVRLPEDFADAPPPPPSFQEPTGQELDDSLFSMDRRVLGDASTADAVAAPERPIPPPEPEPEPERPRATLEMWSPEEEKKTPPRPRRAPSRSRRWTIPVVAVALIGLSLFFSRDLWLPWLGGSDEAATMALSNTAGKGQEEPAAEASETPDAATAEATDELGRSGDSGQMVFPDPATLRTTSTQEAVPPPVASLTGIDRITWKAEAMGLRITLWADGRVASGQVSHHHLGGPNPRELLKIVGVSRPFPSGALEVGDGRVVQIRTGFHETAAGGELHVVFDLTGEQITVREIDTRGSTVNLVLN